MLLPAFGESSLFHATSSLFHVESGQVKSSLFGYHFVNKLHLGLSLRSPSVDSLQYVTLVPYLSVTTSYVVTT